VHYLVCIYKMKVHLLNYFFSVYHRCPRQFDGTLYLRCQTGNGNMLTCETKLFFCVGFPVILDPCIVVIFHSITIIHYGRSFKFWCVCVCVFLSVAWGLHTLFNLLEENLSPCLTRLGGYAVFK
jgi:hypothetical protein